MRIESLVVLSLAALALAMCTPACIEPGGDAYSTRGEPNGSGRVEAFLPCGTGRPCVETAVCTSDSTGVSPYCRPYCNSDADCPVDRFPQIKCSPLVALSGQLDSRKVCFEQTAYEVAIGGASGGSVPGNDTSVCITYDDDQANRPLCGVRGGGLDCGSQYSCTGICNQGPACFARANCCADSCVGFGSNTVCGTRGRLNDNDGTLVSCDRGFASKLSNYCSSANPDWTCCTGSTSPSYLCPPGTQCAGLEGGGYCCTTQTGCSGNYGSCRNGEPCCRGLSCHDGMCRPDGFECTAAGQSCVLGSVDCCGTMRCISLGGTSTFICGDAPPEQQQ